MSWPAARYRLCRRQAPQCHQLYAGLPVHPPAGPHPVKVLSGGERARLLLAKLFAAPSNFLVLDEPTNDLDLETLDLLEETLADYPGTVLVVSHDRDFLDRVVDRPSPPKAMAVSASMPAAIPTCWPSARRRVRSKSAKRLAPTTKKERAPRTAAPKLNFSEQHLLKTLPEKDRKPERHRRRAGNLKARRPRLLCPRSEKVAALPPPEGSPDGPCRR